METIKTLIMLAGIIKSYHYGGADKPQNGYGFYIVGHPHKCLCFERLYQTRAIYSHPGPVIYWQHHFPGPKPWRFKPRHVRGTLEGFPQ